MNRPRRSPFVQDPRHIHRRDGQRRREDGGWSNTGQRCGRAGINIQRLQLPNRRCIFALAIAEFGQCPAYTRDAFGADQQTPAAEKTMKSTATFLAHRILWAVCTAAILGIGGILGGCGDKPSRNSNSVDGSVDGGLPQPDADSPDADATVTDPDGGVDDGGDTDGGVYTYRCEPIGMGYADGFFSLEVFNGKLYAGQFGYGHQTQSMIYRYPPWELVSPGLTGISESVCALEVFDGHLYANTESSGDIYSTADGVNWERVYDGDNGSIGCGLAVLNDTLYAVNYGNAAGEHGRILRRETDTTWTIVYDSGAAPLYLREIVTFNSTLHAFGTQEQQGYLLTSIDGANWSTTPVDNRYFRGHVWNGYLWLGSASYYSSSQTGVWRYDGSQFTAMHIIPDKSHVTDLKSLHGHLFAATSNGWKTDPGPSTLLMSPDGQSDWQIICTFDETAAWNMAVYDGELYVGTWEYGVGGAVYRVIREDI